MANPTRFTASQIQKYVLEGWWEQRTISKIADENALKHQSREAVSDSRGKSLSWKELKIFSDRVALDIIKMGFDKDAVILVQLPNIVENIIMRVALEKSGIITVFVPMTYESTEIKQAIQKSQAKAIITCRAGKKNRYELGLELKAELATIKKVIAVEDWFRDLDLNVLNDLNNQENLEMIEDRRLSYTDINFIGMTSGSTGVAKLCEWPGAPMVLMGKNVATKMSIDENDVVGIIAPLTGGPGLVIWLAAVVAAAKTVLLETYDPEKALRLIEHQGISVVGAVPTQLIKTINQPDLQKYNLSSLKSIRCGGAGISATKAFEVEKALGCKLVTVSGSMETITYTHCSVYDSPQVRHKTVGKPTPGNEIKVLDEQGKPVEFGQRGVMYVRGACTGSGYYQDYETTLGAWGALGEEGWFCSGDIVEIDDQGNIAIVGRQKDIIIRGGQNIYPKEIETLLHSHPKILECLVVGIPDEIMGERTCACIVPKPGKDIKLEEITSYLKDSNLAMFKLPEKIKIFKSFPTVTDGQKIDKKGLLKFLLNE